MSIAPEDAGAGGAPDRHTLRRLLLLATLGGLAWMVARWAASRKRRAIDRQPAPTVAAPPVAPAEPLDGESVEPVGSGSDVA